MKPQFLTAPTQAVFVALILMAIVQWWWQRKRLHAQGKAIPNDFLRFLLLPLFAGYCYADYAVWSWHVLMDHDDSPRTPSSMLVHETIAGSVREVAQQFQMHHITGGLESIVNGNDVENTVEPVISIASLVALALSPLSSARFKLWTAFAFFFVYVAVHNHLCCHAKTNDAQNIPEVFLLLQSWGVLPWPEFHEGHHLLPLAGRWYFLFGPVHYVIEPLYLWVGEFSQPTQLAIVLSTFPITGPFVVLLSGWVLDAGLAALRTAVTAGKTEKLE